MPRLLIVNKDEVGLILFYFKLGIICNGILRSFAVEYFSRRIKIQLLKKAWLKGEDYAGSHRFRSSTAARVKPQAVLCCRS